MFDRLMEGRLRFAIYLFAIVAAVFTGLLLVENGPPTIAPVTLAPERVLDRTPQSVSDAHQEFRVENSAEGNRPLAGMGTGVNWSQFNGPQGDNCSAETGLLENWPETGPPLLWMARGLGPGYSSVAVVDGVVYTMGKKNESDTMIALDAGTGERIWSTPFSPALHQYHGDGPRSTPTVSDGAVYGIGSEGELVCMNAKTGNVIWKLNMLSNYGARKLFWGHCESVLIDGEQLICTPGGNGATIVALDKQTGKEVWKTIIPQEQAGYASAVVTEIGGVRQYVQVLQKGVVGVQADDGTFLWRNDRSSAATANCSSPVVFGNYVFSAASYGAGGALLRLTSVNQTTTAELVYHTEHMKNHHGGMVIANGLLFGSNDPGILVCLELETGRVKWQDRSVGKGAVTYADGRIYVSGENGEIALVEATGDAYREQGRFEQHEPSNQNIWSHPVVAHSRLFLRDQDRLLCYNLKRDG